MNPSGINGLSDCCIWSLNPYTCSADHMVIFKLDPLGCYNLDSKTLVQLFLHAISINEFYIETGKMQRLFSFSFSFHD
jgi:hypothetical protein